MPESSTLLEPLVYQLRVVLRGVSPLIWRRLLVRNDTTIADLHATLQTALGWSDEHLNRFVIHGREYDVSHDGGIGFCDDPRRVHLADLGLRERERFLYEYDFTDGWQHDVRVERILPLDSQRRYPVCVGGRRTVPPEDCGGPWAFLELRRRYSIISIADQLMELVNRRLVIGAEAFVHDRRVSPERAHRGLQRCPTATHRRRHRVVARRVPKQSWVFRSEPGEWLKARRPT